MVASKLKKVWFVLKKIWKFLVYSVFKTHLEKLLLAQSNKSIKLVLLSSCALVTTWTLQLLSQRMLASLLMNKLTKARIQKDSLACKVQNSEHMFMNLIQKTKTMLLSWLVVVLVNCSISIKLYSIG
jgi:hypothetical protein